MLHYNQKIKYAKFLEYSVKRIIRLSFVESGAIIHTKSLITFKDRKVTNNFIFISARFPPGKTKWNKFITYFLYNSSLKNTCSRIVPPVIFREGLYIFFQLLASAAKLRFCADLSRCLTHIKFYLMADPQNYTIIIRWLYLIFYSE